MTETVFINNENMATLVCPRCGKTNTIDVSEYMKSESRVKIKYTFRCELCSCGESSCSLCNTENCEFGVSNEVYLERRKHHRKKVSLPGTFGFIGKDKETDTMTVADISRTALRFSPHVKQDFNENDSLIVVFYLDDERNTRVEKEVRVKEVIGSYVIAKYVSFDPQDRYDREISIYLFTSDSKADGQQ
jgi:hypothetical protein